MTYKPWPKRNPIKNCFLVPNEIFQLKLHPSELAVYSYLLFCEDRKTYIDGHNIDFIKGRVAFDLEWNSKDQTFDRDLLAMRTYYDYEDEYGDDELSSFCVGRLTWEGHDFLDKIRSETVWNKTKETIVKKGLPFVFDVVKELATANMGDMIKVAISCM